MSDEVKDLRHQVTQVTEIVKVLSDNESNNTDIFNVLKENVKKLIYNQQVLENKLDDCLKNQFNTDQVVNNMNWQLSKIMHSSLGVGGSTKKTSQQQSNRSAGGYLDHVYDTKNYKVSTINNVVTRPRGRAGKSQDSSNKSLGSIANNTFSRFTLNNMGDSFKSNNASNGSIKVLPTGQVQLSKTKKYFVDPVKNGKLLVESVKDLQVAKDKSSSDARVKNEDTRTVNESSEKTKDSSSQIGTVAKRGRPAKRTRYGEMMDKMDTQNSSVNTNASETENDVTSQQQQEQQKKQKLLNTSVQPSAVVTSPSRKWKVELQSPSNSPAPSNYASVSPAPTSETSYTFVTCTGESSTKKAHMGQSVSSRTTDIFAPQPGAMESAKNMMQLNKSKLKQMRENELEMASKTHAINSSSSSDSSSGSEESDDGSSGSGSDGSGSESDDSGSSGSGSGSDSDNDSDGDGDSDSDSNSGSGSGSGSSDSGSSDSEEMSSTGENKENLQLSLRSKYQNKPLVDSSFDVSKNHDAPMIDVSNDEEDEDEDSDSDDKENSASKGELSDDSFSSDKKQSLNGLLKSSDGKPVPALTLNKHSSRVLTPQQKSLLLKQLFYMGSPVLSDISKNVISQSNPLFHIQSEHENLFSNTPLTLPDAYKQGLDNESSWHNSPFIAAAYLNIPLKLTVVKGAYYNVETGKVFTRGEFMEHKYRTTFYPDWDSSKPIPEPITNEALMKTVQVINNFKFYALSNTTAINKNHPSKNHKGDKLNEYGLDSVLFEELEEIYKKMASLPLTESFFNTLPYFLMEFRWENIVVSRKFELKESKRTWQRRKALFALFDFWREKTLFERTEKFGSLNSRFTLYHSVCELEAYRLLLGKSVSWFYNHITILKIALYELYFEHGDDIHEEFEHPMQNRKRSTPVEYWREWMFPINSNLPS